MEFIERLRGKSIYLDTNIFIYALEGDTELKGLVTPLFAALDTGDVHGVTSELTLAEVLVHPLRAKDTELADRYERLLSPRSSLTRAPVTAALWREEASYNSGSPMPCTWLLP